MQFGPVLGSRYTTVEPRVRFGVDGVTSGNVAQMPDKKRLYDDVKALTQYMRHSENLAALNQAADYIKGEWTKLGLAVTEQPFLLNGKMYRNLVVSFGPKEGERFIVGAHYDVQGSQPGADDNASGVAGLLEISRLLKKHQPVLKTRLDLVAFTLEEYPNPTKGSEVYAQSMVSGKVPVKGMISLEMIGYFSDEKGSQQYPVESMKALYPDRGNFIGVVGYGAKAMGLVQETQTAMKKHGAVPVHSIYSPVNAMGLDRSDHKRFTDVGIPAVMVTDTANFRNFNYHQVTDTIETLNFEKMAEVVKAVYGMVANL